MLEKHKSPELAWLAAPLILIPWRALAPGLHAMALTLSDITWASLSETRNNRDIIAVSVSERL